MKKGLLILVLCCYALASFGVSLNYFYCCGKLKSVSLTPTTKKQKCCKTMAKKGCCNNKTITYKLSIDQKDHSQMAYHFESPMSNLDLPDQLYNLPSSSTIISKNSIDKRPPPNTAIDRSVLYCVFRI
ncbi:MAG: hypothetical protein WCJ85_05680 [Chitinophagaceae bacterium]